MSYEPTEEDLSAGNSKKPSLKDQQDELQFPDEASFCCLSNSAWPSRIKARNSRVQDARNAA